ncbi:hypothetical protein N0V95_000514 [Ascochyta clinopodiicola]|nr:hypothetical protein N0V95_000514 [Ascochyta clinopodiicola]
MTSSATFGDRNEGFEAGNIYGSVTNTFHVPSTGTKRREDTPQPSIVIPFARDKQFIDRGTLLDEICEQCVLPNARIALVGLGGVGKSQLAIEHAWRTRDVSPTTWVFWAHASSAARLERSFHDIADRVKAAGRENPQTSIFKTVHDWLAHCKERWLLVLDNVDDASFLLGAQDTSSETATRPLRDYLPHCEQGAILVTTRNQEAALQLVEEQDIIRVEPMNEAQSLALLRKKLGAQADNGNTTELAELVTSLEHMPLAIAQAAAYISQRAPLYSVSQYLDHFKKSEHKRSSLLKYDKGQLRRDPEAKNSIITTWQISFEHIQRMRPSAANLLSLMSFFDRQGIPPSVLRVSFKQVGRQASQDGDGTTARIRQEGDQLRPGSTNRNLQDDSTINSNLDNKDDIEDNTQSDSQHKPFSASADDDDDDDDGFFQEDITALRNFCFISANTDGTGFEMHALVQLATRTWLVANGNVDRWRTQFISNLNAVFPSTGEYENWAVCGPLFAHVKMAAKQQPESDLSMLEWAALLYRAARYAYRRKNVTDTEQLAVQSLKTRKKILGEEHEGTWRAMTMVAHAHTLGGRRDKAQTLQEEVLDKLRLKLGHNHPDTLITMGNLASTYCVQGQCDKAEELQLQVLEKRRMELGDNHPYTLTSMHNLALIYDYQGRWKEAEELQLQVLEKQKKVLGDNHLDTLGSMYNLASIYYDQGQWDKAEELQLQVLEKHRKELGDNHIDTLLSMDNLALTYCSQERWNKAEELQLQVLEKSIKELGDNHIDTLSSMHNLAGTYHDQRRWDEAEKLHCETLGLQVKVLGENHRDTLRSMNYLASTYYNQGRWEDAEKLYRKTLAFRVKVFGESHQDTLASIKWVAGVLREQHRYEEALDFYQRAWKGYESTLGPGHPDTLDSISWIAAMFRELQRYQEALVFYKRACEGYEFTLGPEHPTTLNTICWTAYVLKEQHCYQEALGLYERAWKGNESTLGLEHPVTQACTRDLTLVQKIIDEGASTNLSSPTGDSPSKDLEMNELVTRLEQLTLSE